MFLKDEILDKCACNQTLIVTQILGLKRYLVKGRYYTAHWVNLRCEKCGEKREDFHVTYWTPGGNYARDRLRISSLPGVDRKLHYATIYFAIKNQMT